MVHLINAVEVFDHLISSNEANEFEKAKGTIKNYWDIIQEKTKNVKKTMCFSDEDGNSWAVWPEPLPMDSFSENLDPDTVCPCPATEDALSYLWSCSSIQRAVERRHEIQLSDSAVYLLNNIQRICRQDYEPTDEDVLRARVKTVGIVKIQFAFKNLTVSGNDTFSKGCP